MNPELINVLLAAGLLDQQTAEMMIRASDPALARQWAEEQIMQAVSGGLSGQMGRLIGFLQETEFSPTEDEFAEFWQAEVDLLWESMRDRILEVLIERATATVVTSVATTETGLEAIFTRINQQVIEWADTYYIDPDGETFGSVPNLNLTSRTRFSQAFLDWQRGELGARGLDDLIRVLTPIFGPVRAEAIAVTETTRLFVEAQRQAEAANPFTTGWRYLTAADETVCPICLPGNGATADKDADTFSDGGGFPPRHPRCRCDITPETEQTLLIPLMEDRQDA